MGHITMNSITKTNKSIMSAHNILSKLVCNDKLQSYTQNPFTYIYIYICERIATDHYNFLIEGGNN